MLRVGDGATPNATGAYTWVPITDATGAALPRQHDHRHQRNNVGRRPQRHGSPSVQGNGLSASRGPADPNGNSLETLRHNHDDQRGLPTGPEVGPISRLHEHEHHRPRNSRTRGGWLHQPRQPGDRQPGQRLHRGRSQRRYGQRHLVRDGPQPRWRSLIPAKASADGHRTEHPARDSPACISILGTNGGRGSTSSTRPAATTGRSRSPSPDRTRYLPERAVAVAGDPTGGPAQAGPPFLHALEVRAAADVHRRVR